MSLQGKVIAVTGGGSGIGLATAKLISQRGGTVCIADVDSDVLGEVESYFTSITPSVPYMISKVDIANRQEVESWIAEIKDKHGRLDGAANVAGVIGKDHGMNSVAELDDDEWHKIIAVNLTGLMYCLRGELNDISDGGSIVNMASIHATTGQLPLLVMFQTPLSLSNGLTVLRRCQSWCICCEQTRRFGPHSSRCEGKWPPRGSSQCRCAGPNLYAHDAGLL